jgi:sigma-B regulation protein RsbQ
VVSVDELHDSVGVDRTRAREGGAVKVATRHAVQVSGSGPDTYVLAHGFGGDQTQWTAVAAHLSRRARVVTFDLAGSGSCDPAAFSATRHTSLLGFADDLARICADLELRGATFVGHSMSGMSGMLAAAADPGLFARLVVIGASARYINEPATGYIGGLTEDQLESMLDDVRTDFTLWTAGFAPHVMRNEDRPEYATEFTRSLRRYPPEIALAVLRTAFTSDFRSVVPRVTPPTLVLQARQDPAVPDAAARWLADALPQGRLLQLVAQGHFPHVVDPAAVCEAIDEFVLAPAS